MDISIYDYHQKIDKLIEESRLTEAVAHCRHILTHYPRHIATYRLLGKAYLEQQKFADAIDIFLRVLSADPEDFVAHVGLAIAYKTDQLIPQATWHLERAFEMDPYNTIIQEELRTLYTRRHGVAPERLMLTQGALTRLHLRSELYAQAIAEARQLLAQDSQRVDLQALLMEALWRDDQRVDAVGVGLDLLDHLPNCLKANAILAEVWLLTGRTAEAQEYLHRLIPMVLLDKSHASWDTPAGTALLTEGSPTLPDEITLEELDETAISLVTAEQGAVDWVNALETWDDMNDPSAAQVDWFSDAPDLSWFHDQTPPDTSQPPDVPPVVKMEVPPAEVIPDWLQQLQEEVGQDLFAEPEPEEIDLAEMPADAMNTLANLTSSDIDESEPSWLEEEPVTLESQPFELEHEEDIFEDWLGKALSGYSTPEPIADNVPATVTVPEEAWNDVPNWLHEPEATDDPSVIGLLDELAALDEDELDDALPASPPIPPISPEPTIKNITESNAMPDIAMGDLPDWLQDLETPSSSPQPSVSELWQQLSPAGWTIPADTTSDNWLLEEDDKDIFELPPTVPTVETGDLPAWIRAEPSKHQPIVAKNEDLPEWIAADLGAVTEGSPITNPQEPSDLDALDDWFTQLDSEADWLAELGKDEKEE